MSDTLSKKKRLWCRAWVWAVLVLFLLGVIFVAVCLYLTSPTFVRRMILKHASVKLRGNLSVADARVQLFRGLKLRDARLAPTAAAEPAVTIERLRCDWNPAAFLHGEVEPRRLVIIRPKVHLEITPENGVNLAHLFVRQDLPPPDPWQFERYFSEGIFVESGELHWTAPQIFGDAQPRIFSGMDVVLHRASEGFERWDLEALVRGSPLDGARISGWIDADGERWRTVYLGRAEELEISDEMIGYLPAPLQELLSRFALEGRVTLDALIDVQHGGQLNYVIEARLNNVNARFRTKALSVRALDVQLRFDPAGFSCETISGVLWDGALLGKTSNRAGGGFTIRLVLDRANLARMAAELGLADRELDGWMDASAQVNIEPGTPAGWTGNGAIKIADAHLAKLPVLAQALSLLQLRLPREEIFDEGECRFSVRDNKVLIERAVISSPSIEVTASGEIGFDGNVHMILLVAGSQRGEAMLLVRVWRVVIGGIEREIMPPVQITGTLANPETRLLTMEPIKRQFRRLWDLLPFVGKSEAKTNN